ncbi:hemerythrin domain-containing protein [Amycolatopsis sp. FDAARGOS 1241]|uniref:hemerythrin domain-containing protein n=1 Tax=Amycolatopsis sp. FDAARGOS 1241 TaxID=2778070 RepID=UPI00194EEF91|nr:hemerythrin domain-containing protein [Amycolatopsis sp. FDAARGOS 1241]QRP50093.1 hemerythrin domain-containing protein [Amycolatopsis sp. FDAARGOS 1241]
MADNENVIDLLLEQHREVRAMFTELETASGARRTELFHHLVGLLAVHETAEEEVVHPEIRDLEPAAETVVEARVAEERRAKELLSTLQSMGPDADGFDTLLVQLRDDVLAHAEHEEREEFPFLRAHRTPERLRAMAATVRLAEAVAPTRPHPGVESATANLLLGPPAAIVDRARDAIRAALRK